MNQRQRMFKALGGLCVAMTGTAAGLAWMDPSIPEIETELSGTELAQWADAVVAEEVQLLARAWREVEIVADESPTRGTMLAAASAPPPAHFHVDQLGRLSRMTYWEQQAPVIGDDYTIRILVSFPRETQRLSRRQWSSVRALVLSIETSGVAAYQPVPVRVDFDPTERPPSPPIRLGLASHATAPSPG
jgi:hypothetical protein